MTKKEKKYSGTEPLDNVQHLLQESRSPMDERLSWLYGEISKLDEIDRSIMFLYLNDKTYQEIAGIMGISVTNVSTKISRIRQKLKSKF